MDTRLHNQLVQFAKAVRRHGIRRTARDTHLSPMRVTRITKRCSTPETDEVIDVRILFHIAITIGHPLLLPLPTSAQTPNKCGSHSASR